MSNPQEVPVTTGKQEQHDQGPGGAVLNGVITDALSSGTSQTSTPAGAVTPTPGA